MPIHTYPLPEGTLILHHPTREVYEVLDPPGRFRIKEPKLGGNYAGQMFSNSWFYDEAVRQPHNTVSVLDCPAHINRVLSIPEGTTAVGYEEDDDYIEFDEEDEEESSTW